MRLSSDKPKVRTALILLLTLLTLPANTLASISTIWAVNDGEKVERDDLNNPNRKQNSAWDGRKIKIFGARNEIIAFQVIVGAGTDGIRQLSARLPSLRQQKG